MAHYKRGKCRYQSSSRRNGTAITSYRAKFKLKPIIIPDGMNYFEADWGDYHRGRSYRWGYPRWHDILYHSRPRRRQERLCASIALRDLMDLDELVWPLEKKPHKYYW